MSISDHAIEEIGSPSGQDISNNILFRHKF